MATDHILDRQFYFDGFNNKQLLIQRCRNCELMRFPAIPVCNQCKSRQWDAIPSEGRGVVYSYIIMRRPQMPQQISSTAAIVALDEGVLVVSSVVGIEPEEITFDMPVQLEFTSSSDDQMVHVFRPL